MFSLGAPGESRKLEGTTGGHSTQTYLRPPPTYAHAHTHDYLFLQKASVFMLKRKAPFQKLTVVGIYPLGKITLSLATLETYRRFESLFSGIETQFS